MLRKELERFSRDAFPKIGCKVGRHAATTQRPISIMLQYISEVRCPIERLANKDRLVLRCVVLPHRCHLLWLQNLAAPLEISKLNDHSECTCRLLNIDYQFGYASRNCPASTRLSMSIRPGKTIYEPTLLRARISRRLGTSETQACATSRSKRIVNKF